MGGAADVGRTGTEAGIGDAGVFAGDRVAGHSLRIRARSDSRAARVKGWTILADNPLTLTLTTTYRSGDGLAYMRANFWKV